MLPKCRACAAAVWADAPEDVDLPGEVEPEAVTSSVVRGSGIGGAPLRLAALREADADRSTFG